MLDKTHSDWEQVEEAWFSARQWARCCMTGQVGPWEAEAFVGQLPSTKLMDHKPKAQTECKQSSTIGNDEVMHLSDEASSQAL